MSAKRSELDPANSRLGDVLDLLAALVAVGLLILVASQQQNAARLILVLAFTGYVPGRAVVSNWPELARWSEAAMPMVFSIVILGLLATTFLWSGYWHPIGLFQVEALLSLLGLCLGYIRRHDYVRIRPGSYGVAPARSEDKNSGRVPDG